MKGLFSLGFAFIILSCGEPLNVIQPGQGDKIIFISTRNAEDWQIFKMNFDGTDPAFIIDKIVKYGSQSVSPDGRQLAVIDKQTDNLNLCNIDGSYLHPLTAFKGYSGFPSWSPTSDRLIYLKKSSNSDKSNWLMLYDFRQQKEIALLNRSNYSSPIWLNSNEILFTIIDDNYKSILYTLNLSSGVKKTINPSAISVSTIVVSPDGKHIAVTTLDFNGSQIVVLNSDGGDYKQLTSSVSPIYFDWGKPRDGNESPTWSPNGSKLAYVSHEDGDSEIFTMNVDGSHKTQLTFNQEQDVSPGWSKDGKYIFFTSNRERFSGLGFEVFRMDSIGNDPINLTKSSGSDIFIATY